MENEQGIIQIKAAISQEQLSRIDSLQDCAPLLLNNLIGTVILQFLETKFLQSNILVILRQQRNILVAEDDW